MRAEATCGTNDEETGKVEALTRKGKGRKGEGGEAIADHRDGVTEAVTVEKDDRHERTRAERTGKERGIP